MNLIRKALLDVEKIISGNADSYEQFSVLVRTNPVSNITAQFYAGDERKDDYIRFRASI